MKLSDAQELVREEQFLGNKNSQATAMLAQLTCQINSSAEAVTPELSVFLPWPMLGVEVFDSSIGLVNTLLRSKDKLQPELASLIEDPGVISRLYGTLYWESGQFLYL